LEIGDSTSTNLQSPNLLISSSLLFSLLLAAFLRFYQLDASSLWNDEGNSWAMLSRSFGEIAAAAAADIHPPGYYWLLKLWSLIFGDSAVAMRGLSAVLGVLLLALIAAIAQRAVRDHAGWRWYPVLAVLLAAVNPFQIYYSQEARMYMLLAVETTGLFLALLWMMEIENRRVEIESSENSQLREMQPRAQATSLRFPHLLFLLFGAAGLWTHYSFPIVLAAAGLTFVTWWMARSLRPVHFAPLRRYIMLNLLIVLAFLPWLPTAIDRVLSWPKGGADVGLLDGVALTLRTLLFGPLRSLPEPLWPWLMLAGILPLIGLIALRRLPRLALMTGLWLLLPVAMMVVLGLFTDAFLKFLLVASPAWCLMVAAAPWVVLPTPPARPPRRVLHSTLVAAVAAFGVGAALLTLPGYYIDPFARDNYRGVARYLAAIGDAPSDLVLLNAPGQQEVWRIYDPGLPVLALPMQRPADAAAVEAQLAEATANKRRIFALLWATDEADPERIVERWLDANTFKAMESWQGNLRFATYALADELAPLDFAPVRWENGMVLTAVAQPPARAGYAAGAETGAPAQRVEPGDAALIQLHWLAEQPLTQRYKVSVQLLDDRNQVIAQHDSEPGGGAHPTDRWQIGESMIDNHGIAIPFGAPPGAYRLMATLYDAASGERVQHRGQEMLTLGSVIVERAAERPPLEVIPMQHRSDVAMGPLQFVGYDVYRRGFAHAPETPIQPGDTVHFTLYWLAPDTLPTDWPADLTMTLRLGNQQITTPLAGGAHPTARWQAGDLVRGDFDLVYDGAATQPLLTVQDVAVALRSLPVQR
jgi:hypothetical protein